MVEKSMKCFTVKFDDAAIVMESIFPRILVKMLIASFPHWKHLPIESEYLGNNVMLFKSREAGIWRHCFEQLHGALSWEIGEIEEFLGD